MSTLSVPLPDEMRMQIKLLVTEGDAPNEAALARKAIQEYLRRQAVEEIRRARKEPSLEGDLDELMTKV